MIFCLLFSHGAVIIDKYECPVVVRIDIAGSAFVAGTKIALQELSLEFFAAKLLTSEKSISPSALGARLEKIEIAMSKMGTKF
jgi:hypothetical protein